MKPLVSVIIPAYNEAESIGGTINSILSIFNDSKINGEILVIDDSSTDKTYEAAKKIAGKNNSVRVVSKGLPRGMGSGIIKGISEANGKVGIIAMADGVDDLKAIPDFIKKIVEEKFVVVVGSRYLAQTDSRNIPLMYKFCSRLYRLFCVLFLGIPLKDLTNAYRAFDLDFAKKAKIESTGFEISAEITSKGWFYCKERVAEIPCLHKKRGKGYSKFSFMRAAPGYFRIFSKSLVLRLTKKWI